MMFAAQCQLAAGVFVLSNDILETARTIHRTLAAARECLLVCPNARLVAVIAEFARRALGALEQHAAVCGAGSAQPSAGALAAIVERHGSVSLTLREVSVAIDRSYAYVSDRVSKQTGYRFATHVHAFRVLRCAMLLADTADPMYRIARNCGYTRSFQLARHFKEMLGVAPMRFRRMLDAHRAVCSNPRRNV